MDGSMHSIHLQRRLRLPAAERSTYLQGYSTRRPLHQISRKASKSANWIDIPEAMTNIAFFKIPNAWFLPFSPSTSSAFQC